MAPLPVLLPAGLWLPSRLLGIVYFLTVLQSAASLTTISKPPTFADLQKCVTPQEMLDRVGSRLNLTSGYDREGVLASTLLVRLSKQLISLDNNRESNHSTTAEKWQWQWQCEPLTNVVDTLVAAPWESSAVALDAAVEGIKAASVLSRLCPESVPVVYWEPLWNKWDDVAVTVAKDLQPHQLSGLKWSSDCFQFLATEHHSDRDLKLPTEIQEAYEDLNLPFCIRPGSLADIEDLTVDHLVDQVQFRVDTIRTTSNKIVKERRQTAWEGDETVAPFEYSGKSMPRKPWSPLVRAVRDQLHSQTGIYYDGCLLNLYPDGGSGMRYHSDPDQGTLWDYYTAVVSIGATRKFAFREVPSSISSQTTTTHKPHVFTLMQGDCTEMFADCQTQFQHTVKTAETMNEAMARSSLVFKKTLSQDTR